MNPNQIVFKKDKTADVLGIISSLLCVVHCIATPLLITLGAGYFTNPWIKYFFLAISCLFIFKVTWHSTHLKINVLLWFSFIGFCICTILEDAFASAEVIGYLFVMLIITGHILHLKDCNKCNNHA